MRVRLLRYGVMILGETLIAAIALVALRPPFALAPVTITTHPALRSFQQAQAQGQDLSTLHAIYRALQADLQAQRPTLRHSRNLALLTPYWADRQVAYQLAQRLQREQQYHSRYTQALGLATQAHYYQRVRAKYPVTRGELGQEARLWRQAIAELSRIPPDSTLATQATVKQSHYYDILTEISRQVHHLEAGFLTDIAHQLPHPQALHLTLCPIEGGPCQDYQGHLPPVSAASLIKIPLAIALMDKVTQQHIDWVTPLAIQHYNYTETSESSISVNDAYPLRDVMASMVKHSNNIATNELIDYLSWEFIAQRLGDRGYTTTTVNSKLVGDRTYPSHNMNSGAGPNQITTNELSHMVRQIYRFRQPSDAALLVALARQSNPDFGQAAIAQMQQPRVSWIGEKWGQNSQVIGTVVVFRVDDRRYVLSLALDHSNNLTHLHQVIQQVIQHILDTSHRPATLASQTTIETRD